MKLGFYLPAHWADIGRHAVHMYREMLREAKEAERLGFSSLHIPEHHFINYLTHPNPLITAARVAAETSRIPIVTAVLVLPLYDMRRLAGEVALADCLTEGRLEIGVGRGAFQYEFGKFGKSTDPDDQRREFDESLAVLVKLLSEEEVSWHGELYRFDGITTTPRPLQRPHPPIWIAAVTPPAIYHCAKAGRHVMTMPLRTQADGPRLQCEAMVKARAEGSTSRFAMLQFVYVARDETDAAEKLAICHTAQKRFHNMFSTPGDVRRGDIVPHDIALTIEELRARTVIGTIEECREKLEAYRSLGVDEIVCNMSFGVPHEDVLASQRRLAEHVMPHLAGASEPGSAP